MADTYTKIADLIDPEVMGDMVSARIPKKLRVAPFAKVDDTLAGVPGDTITVPAYAYIGDADIVAEGEAVTIEKMTTSTRKATVKKAMKGIGLTDEAVLSGYGNPVGEANTQLAMAIAAKIDNDCMDVLQTATLTYDGSAGIISYAGVVDAVDALPPAAGTGALFPKGVEQTDRWQNLLGQVTARQKMQLVLRLNLPFVPGDANLSAQTARRLLELQAWVAEQSAAGLAPQLGNADPVQETLTAGAARLEQANDEGSAVYTVTLTAHYTMKWSDTFED